MDRKKEKIRRGTDCLLHGNGEDFTKDLKRILKKILKISGKSSPFTHTRLKRKERANGENSATENRCNAQKNSHKYEKSYKAHGEDDGEVWRRSRDRVLEIADGV